MGDRGEARKGETKQEKKRGKERQKREKRIWEGKKGEMEEEWEIKGIRETKKRTKKQRRISPCVTTEQAEARGTKDLNHPLAPFLRAFHQSHFNRSFNEVSNRSKETTSSLPLTPRKTPDTPPPPPSQPLSPLLLPRTAIPHSSQDLTPYPPAHLLTTTARSCRKSTNQQWSKAREQSKIPLLPSASQPPTSTRRAPSLSLFSGS